MSERSDVVRILTGASLFVIVYILPSEGMAEVAAYAVPYLVLGYPVIYKAARNIVSGNVFDENLLMTIATLGAFAIGEYPEGVAVMLFFQIGMAFEDRAVDRSRRSIAELMDIQPEYANLESDGGMVRTVPSEISVGDIILVKPGEKVPLDGIVVSGTSAADTSALTGESVPRTVSEGDEIPNGIINLTGVLRVRVSRPYSDSTVSRILEMVEDSGSRKSSQERFITRFARYYTPAVIAAALTIAVVPTLLIPGAEFMEWVSRALIFLVISCPCALVISVPLSFFGGIGGASRNGVLIKGGNHMEALADTETVVFDKTGTLTEGSFEVRKIESEGMSQAELLKYAAYAESCSDHPIARSIVKAYGGEIVLSEVRDFREVPGQGVVANVSGHDVMVGTAELVGTGPRDSKVHVSVDGEYRGSMTVEDRIKPDARRAVIELKEAGVGRVVMLTGDSEDIGRRVAAELGIDEVYPEMLPADKVRITEELSSELVNGKLAFVGDGVNDAPALARADIGVAMGALGSDAAIEAADVVMMTDEPSKMATAIRISKKTVGIAKQNIVLAISIKAVVMVLGLMDAATMWEAMFADVGVMIIAVLNSMRTFRYAVPDGAASFHGHGQPDAGAV